MGSETAKPKKPPAAGPSQRSARSVSVQANAKAAEVRRTALAEDFRARLTAELGPNDSVTREALILAATSAYVEVKEISGLFLRCRAGDNAMSRLSNARGQLSRALRLLGVAAAPSSESPGEARGGISDYLERLRSARAEGEPKEEAEADA